MILSSAKIQEKIEENIIKIYPMPKQIQPASIDLRLNKVFEVKSSDGKPIDLVENNIVYNSLPFDSKGGFIFKKNKHYLFETKENLSVTDDIAQVYIAQRSSLARLFCDIVPVSGELEYKIDPPFSNKVLCSIVSRAFNIKLYKGSRVVQAIFISNPSRFDTVDLHASKEFMEPYFPYKNILDTNENWKNLFRRIHQNKVILINYPGDLMLENRANNIGPLFLTKTNQRIDFSDAKTGGIIDQSIMKNSSFIRSSLAPFVDPGYTGHLTMTLIGSVIPQTINNNDLIARMKIYKIDGNVPNPYGSISLGSKYQGISNLKDAQYKSV